MGRLRKENWLATSIRKDEKNKNQIHLLGQCWEQQTISLIAFIFGVLVNVGKKIVCLQCGFKSCRESRDIDCDYDIILQKHSLV